MVTCNTSLHSGFCPFVRLLHPFECLLRWFSVCFCLKYIRTKPIFAFRCISDHHYQIDNGRLHWDGHKAKEWHFDTRFSKCVSASSPFFYFLQGFMSPCKWLTSLGASGVKCRTFKNKNTQPRTCHGERECWHFTTLLRAITLAISPGCFHLIAVQPFMRSTKKRPWSFAPANKWPSNQAR